ncbi:MAG TPA: YicC/YloC family endoribonuclease [Thermoanaerobaculia bacterium]|nr:YicC/YloC family endoribonuclease [Thermoanaerobaculia bacterium]
MTLRSMTGFGQARGPVGDAMAELSVRSVNHRFLDVAVKVRETEAVLEPVLRRVYSRRVARGKVEVALRWTRPRPVTPRVSINEGLFESLLGRVGELAKKYPITERVEVCDLLTVPQMVTIEDASADFSPREIASLEALAEESARALSGMRESEGALIAANLRERIAFLQERLERLAARREELARQILSGLRERLQGLVPGVPMDPHRLEQEAALLAERSDIAEELQRLQGHLEQFTQLIDCSAEPVGKKLDFLSQEILRELNTLGSKARDLRSVREVLEMKAETEKIREQVQNVE